MKKSQNQQNIFNSPVEFPSGIPLYHFRFVVESNHVPKSAARCDFAFHEVNPSWINWISNDFFFEEGLFGLMVW